MFWFLVLVGLLEVVVVVVAGISLPQKCCQNWNRLEEEEETEETGEPGEPIKPATGEGSEDGVFSIT